MSNPTALLPEHESLVESFVNSGRYEGSHAVITAALKLLQEKERERAARLSALHAVLAAEMPLAQPLTKVNIEEASSEIERLLSSEAAGQSAN